MAKVRKKDIDALKDKWKEEKKKDIKIDDSFVKNHIVFLDDLGLHVATVYKLLKVKHIDQMLNTMYETVIEQYKLHEQTVAKLLNDRELRHKVENKIGKRIPI